jgi:Lrp/AsnC family leucine-responsive transcriptional regulator
VGFGVTGFIHLQMEHHTPEIAAAFEREVAAMRLVVSCHNLSGHYDYMLEVVGSDLESFSSFVRNKIRCLPGVKEISTSFSLNEIKRSNVMPLE